jgi:hypothetical protein
VFCPSLWPPGWPNLPAVKPPCGQTSMRPRARRARSWPNGARGLMEPAELIRGSKLGIATAIPMFAGPFRRPRARPSPANRPAAAKPLGVGICDGDEGRVIRRCRDRRAVWRWPLHAGGVLPCRRRVRPARDGIGRVRAISTGRLHRLLGFDLRPIDVVVFHGSRRDLVLRRASRLDAFSGYPVRT